MARSNSLYYINPNAISLTPNANGSENDIAVYIQKDTKIKYYDKRALEAAGFTLTDGSFPQSTLTGRNRRLNVNAHGNVPYTIYARVYASGAYLVFAPKTLNQTTGQYEDKYIPFPYIYSPLPSFETYIKMGEVSAIGTDPSDTETYQKRTVTLDTGILGTDVYNAEWEVIEDDLPYRIDLTASVSPDGETFLPAGSVPKVRWQESLLMRAALIQGWDTEALASLDHWTVERNSGDDMADAAWNTLHADVDMQDGLLLRHERFTDNAVDDLNGKVASMFTFKAYGIPLRPSSDSNSSDSSDVSDSSGEIELLAETTVTVLAEAPERYELWLSSDVVRNIVSQHKCEPEEGVNVKIRAISEDNTERFLSFDDKVAIGLHVFHQPVDSEVAPEPDSSDSSAEPPASSDSSDSDYDDGEDVVEVDFDGENYGTIGTEYFEEGATSRRVTLYYQIGGAYVELCRNVVAYVVDGEQGASGKNAVRIDLDNQADAVAVDAEGYVRFAKSVTVNVRIYDGATVSTAARLADTVEHLQEAWRIPNRAAGNSYIVPTFNDPQSQGYSGVMTVTWAFNTPHKLDKGIIEKTLSLKLNGVIYEAKFHLTVSDTLAVYQLLPSKTEVSFTRDANGDLQPASQALYCGYKKVDADGTTAFPGNVVANLWTGGGAKYNIFYRFLYNTNGTETHGDWMWAKDLTGGVLTIARNASYFAIEYVLSSASDTVSVADSNIMDRETIPIVKDGQNGTTPTVAIINGEWWINGTNTHIQAEGKDGTGVALKGSVDVLNAIDAQAGQTSLEALTGMSVGDCWVVDANRHLYFYNGVGQWPANWTDLGEFKGEDGKSSYLHIAWATNIEFGSGSDSSDSDSSSGDEPGDLVPVAAEGFSLVKVQESYDWVGYCANDSEQDPTDFRAYKWNYQKGKDGNGYEYVYLRSKTEMPPTVYELDTYRGKTRTDDEYLPAVANYTQNGPFEYRRFTDDPKGVTQGWPYEYQAFRKKVNGTWHPFSTPATLHRTYSKPGNSPVEVFKWFDKDYNVTANDKPAFTIDQYNQAGRDENIAQSSGWYKNAQNREHDSDMLYMSQNTIDGTTGAFVGIWSTPIAISGPEGTPGEDGTEREWIYKRNDTQPTDYNSKTGTANGHDISGKTGDIWNADLTDDFVPTGWSDSPQGVDENSKTEWASWRDKDKETEVWGDFHSSIRWSHYGERGMDGDGMEYVFARSESSTPPQIANNNNYTEGGVIHRVTDDEFLPAVTGAKTMSGSSVVNAGRATDNPQGVSQQLPYEWVAKRTKGAPNDSGVRTWNGYTIGPMSLWAKWAADGTSGDSPLSAYRWYKSGITPIRPTDTQRDEPLPASDDTSDSTKVYPTGKWSKTAPNRPEGENWILWMITSVKHKTGPDTYNRDAWSNPIQISGEKGEPGNDTSGREYIYKNSTSSTSYGGAAPSEIDRGQVHGEGDWIPKANQYVVPDYVPEGWSDTAIAVTPNVKYVYISVRMKTDDGNGNYVWGDFSEPVLWSNWGETGMDGDGVQYVYKLYADKLSSTQEENYKPVKADDAPDSTTGEWEANNNPSDLTGGGWYDDAPSPTPDKPYCYCSVIKKINNTWGNFGKLALWSKWSSNGEIPAMLFKQDTTGQTVSAPNCSAANYMAGTNLPSGWSKTAPNRETGKDLWMSQNTILREDGVNYTLKDEYWSTPVRISGDKGDNGEDAADREWIYIGHSEYHSPYTSEWTHPKSVTRGKVHGEGDWIPKANQYAVDDYVPEGWSDNAVATNDGNNKFVYASYRDKPRGSTTWGDFSDPILWSNWGVQGIDGDGVQYIYKLFPSELDSTARSNQRPTNATFNTTTKEWMPTPENPATVNNGWYDDPQAPDSNNPYCYCAVIKKINGQWNESGGYGVFEPLALWSKWTADGTPGAPAPYIHDTYYGWSAYSTGSTDPGDVTWSRAVPSKISGKPYLWMKDRLGTWNSSSSIYLYGDYTYTRMTGEDGTGVAIRGSFTWNDVLRAFPEQADTSMESYWVMRYLLEVHQNPSVSDCYIYEDNGHLWVWTGTRWQDVGRIKGDDGTSQYIHIAWAHKLGTGINWTNQNTGFTTSKNAKDVYEYMGVLANNDQNNDPDITHAGEYTWDLVQGPQGTSPWIADFDNEMDSVACDANGHPDGEQTLQTNLRLYYGSSQENFWVSGVTVNGGDSKAGVNMTFANSSYANASVNGYLQVKYGTSATINGKDEFVVTLTSWRDTTVSRQLTFTVVGVKPGPDGKPATLYKIVPSVDVIKCDKNGTLTPASPMTCTVQKISDDSVSTPSQNEGELRYRKDNDITASGQGTKINLGGSIACDNTNKYITIAYFVGNVLRDKERVPIVFDGSDGPAGQDMRENIIDNSEPKYTFDVPSSMDANGRCYSATDKSYVPAKMPADGRKVSGQARVTITGCSFNGTGRIVLYCAARTDHDVGYVYVVSQEVTANGTYDLKFEGKTVNSNGGAWTGAVRLQLTNFVASQGSVTVERLKLEEGEKCSAWCLSENDKKGTSPWVADLDNEMDSVACDTGWHPAYNQTVGTNLSMLHGSTPEAFTITGIERKKTFGDERYSIVLDGVGDKITVPTGQSSVSVTTAVEFFYNGSPVSKYVLMARREADGTRRRIVNGTFPSISTFTYTFSAGDTIEFFLWEPGTAPDLTRYLYKMEIPVVSQGSAEESGVTATWDNSTGAVSVFYTPAALVNGSDDFEITMQATSDNSIVRKLHFTVNGILPGKDGQPATIYNLKPSQTEINVGRTADGAYNPSTFTLTCGYTKNRGGAMTSVADVTGQIDSTYNIYFRRRTRGADWGSTYYIYTFWQSVYLVDASVASYDAVQFILCTDTLAQTSNPQNVIDRETVPIVADGEKGADGKDAAQVVFNVNPVLFETDNSGHVLVNTYMSETMQMLVDGTAVNITKFKFAKTGASSVSVRHTSSDTVYNANTEYSVGATSKAFRFYAAANATGVNGAFQFTVTGEDTNGVTYTAVGVVPTAANKVGAHGDLGPMLYPAGIWNKDTEYAKDGDCVPYVLYEPDGKYYRLTAGTAEGGSQSPENANYWAEVTQFDAVFAKFLIAKYGQMASAIFCGDWMYSQYGKLYVYESNTKVEYTVDNSSDQGHAKYDEPFNLGKVPYCYFNPAYPRGNSSNSRDYPLFAPTYAVDLKTGKVYMYDANIEGSVTAKGSVGSRLWEMILDQSGLRLFGSNYQVGQFHVTFDGDGHPIAELFMGVNNSDEPHIIVKSRDTVDGNETPSVDLSLGLGNHIKVHHGGVTKLGYAGNTLRNITWDQLFATFSLNKLSVLDVQDTITLPVENGNNFVLSSTDDGTPVVNLPMLSEARDKLFITGGSAFSVELTLSFTWDMPLCGYQGNAGAHDAPVSNSYFRPILRYRNSWVQEHTISVTAACTLKVLLMWYGGTVNYIQNYWAIILEDKAVVPNAAPMQPIEVAPEPVSVSDSSDSQSSSSS